MFSLVASDDRSQIASLGMLTCPFHTQFKIQSVCSPHKVVQSSCICVFYICVFVFLSVSVFVGNTVELLIMTPTANTGFLYNHPSLCPTFTVFESVFVFEFVAECVFVYLCNSILLTS